MASVCVFDTKGSGGWGGGGGAEEGVCVCGGGGGGAEFVLSTHHCTLYCFHASERFSLMALLRRALHRTLLFEGLLSS